MRRTNEMPAIFIPSSLWRMNAHQRVRYMVSWYYCLPHWKQTMLSPFTYFSIWSLCFLVGYEWWKGMESDTLTCLLLWNTWLCSLVGGYMTLVYPRRLYVYYLHVVLDQGSLISVDLLSHQLPFLYTWYYYRHRLAHVSMMSFLWFLRWIYVEWIIYLLWITLYDHGYAFTLSTMFQSIYRRYHLRVTDIFFLFVFSQYMMIVWYLLHCS